MNDRVVTVLSTHLPVLGAAASQQGTKVIGINQDPCIYRQSDHLFRSASGLEISGELRVTIRLSAEMIQGVQQGLRGRIHAGPQVMEERYQGTFTTVLRHGACRFSRLKLVDVRSIGVQTQRFWGALTPLLTWLTGDQLAEIRQKEQPTKAGAS